MFENQSSILMKTATTATLDTVSKVQIDLSCPTEDKIQIEDIAAGLSMICRFGGQIQRFYSVAQHSLLVAALAPMDLKREALLHDAAEAYLGDVIKPLKVLLGAAYKQIETNFETVIFQKFGCDISRIGEIKKYDLQAYDLEDQALREGDTGELAYIMNAAGMVLANRVIFYEPTIARMEFLRVFGTLFNDRSRMEG